DRPRPAAQTADLRGRRGRHHLRTRRDGPPPLRRSRREGGPYPDPGPPHAVPPVPAVLPTPEPGAEVATKAPAGSRRGPSVSRRRRLAEVILRARLVRDALGAVSRRGRRLQRLPRPGHRRIEALRDSDEGREEDDVRRGLLGERPARAEDEDDRGTDGREADRDEPEGRLRELRLVEEGADRGGQYAGDDDEERRGEIGREAEEVIHESLPSVLVGQGSLAQGRARSPSPGR